ncbi:hypothetical protein BGZ51_000814 [Haplosporangium sp. Z 767]|nr:hypothetical protein BGZ51_000814 [Haplosporangium sp. Z 767]
MEADFIRDVYAGHELDPGFPASTVGRREKYDFRSSQVWYIMHKANQILQKADQAGRNAKAISRICPPMMEVIEQVIYLNFKREIDF